jgi:hypothetical protein
MSLIEMARRVVAPRATRPASEGGAATSRLTGYVEKRLQGDPRGYADGTVATVAWHILRDTQAYQSLVKRLGATPAIWRLGDFVVTALTEANVSRFVLLALDPTLPPSHAPRAAEVEFAQAALDRAYERWAQRMLRQGSYGAALVDATKPEIVIEFARAQGLQLVVGAMPLELEYTAERPTPPFAVEDAAGAQDVSMGVYSDSKQHGPGLTSAAHGITIGGNYSLFDAGILIDSVQGIVTNSVLDAAFLRLSKAPRIPSPVGRSFLSGVTPNVQLQHEFHGAQSGLTQATVSGWVDDLLTIEPWLQNRVFTQRILQQRDSGSALIDANDRVIGFAFYNSSTFANPTLSAWIWADSVRQDFDLA